MARLLLRAALVLALAIPFFWRLGAEEFHGDESHWISSGQEAFYLATSGRLDDPLWREQFYLYSQPQVGKLLIGAALALSGHYGPIAIYDYDWQRRPWENRADGRVPPDAALLAGRIPSALAGWFSCLLLWWLAAQLGAGEAGLLAAVLLASHPLWLANARRGDLDAPSLCLGLLSAGCVLRALASPAAHARHGPPPCPAWAPATPSLMEWGPGGGPPHRLLWWGLAGAALGLAAGTKYVGLLAAPAALGPALRSLRQWRSGRDTLLGCGLAIAVAVGVFWLANPTLYGRPLEGVRASVDFLTTQAADMRRNSPTFQSPPLVAAEIFDRAIWPTRVPVVVDLTLPDPLIPGSYGTPVVGLGGGIALVLFLGALARRRPAPPAMSMAVVWASVVFVLLTLSVPIWWERWHLPLIPSLCLLAGLGLAGLRSRFLTSQWPPRLALVGLPVAQFVAALAMSPSYLGRGFGALVTTPVGGGGHLLALACTLAALVSHRPQQFAAVSGERESWQVGKKKTVPSESGSSAREASPEPTPTATKKRQAWSSSPPVT